LRLSKRNFTGYPHDVLVYHASERAPTDSETTPFFLFLLYHKSSLRSMVKNVRNDRWRPKSTERKGVPMVKKKMAHYKVISDSGGNRYGFYCDLSGALLCTSKVYSGEPSEETLTLVWEEEGKAHFQFCHKCGRWVMDAMFNADALECVSCAPWENTPEFCKFCGIKVSHSDSVCPKCGKGLIYGGEFNDRSQKE